jgi:hypothetical protein
MVLCGTPSCQAVPSASQLGAPEILVNVTGQTIVIDGGWTAR